MALMMSRLDTAPRNAGTEVGDGDDNRFSRLEREVRRVRWMLGFNLALSVAILVKLFL